VKVTLLPSAVGPDKQFYFCTSYIINDCLAIDAGSLGFHESPQVQVQVRDVLVSHTHIDHIASLAIFVENAYEGKADCVTIHGSSTVLDCLQRDVFNNRLWPDFITMSANSKAPFLKLAKLEAGRRVEIAGLRITPVDVNHVVPTFGFIIEDAGGTIAISSDTGPTQELWTEANRTANLKSVFLEATFPNNLQWLADVSKHLTPAQFAQEVAKLNRPVPVIAVHLKARFRQAVMDELRSLGLANLQIGEPGRTYSF
jgi:cAMP phosphodiesterase